MSLGFPKVSPSIFPVLFQDLASWMSTNSWSFYSFYRVSYSRVSKTWCAPAFYSLLWIRLERTDREMTRWPQEIWRGYRPPRVRSTCSGLSEAVKLREQVCSEFTAGITRIWLKTVEPNDNDGHHEDVGRVWYTPQDYCKGFEVWCSPQGWYMTSCLTYSSSRRSRWPKPVQKPVSWGNRQISCCTGSSVLGSRSGPSLAYCPPSRHCLQVEITANLHHVCSSQLGC